MQFLYFFIELTRNTNENPKHEFLENILSPKDPLLKENLDSTVTALAKTHHSTIRGIGLRQNTHYFEASLTSIPQKLFGAYFLSMAAEYLKMSQPVF